jgi:hypothetical protein
MCYTTYESTIRYLRKLRRKSLGSFYRQGAAKLDTKCISGVALKTPHLVFYDSL